MPGNTVYGPYGKTSWVDGTTMGNQTRMNNLETQAQTALNGINPDLSGPFVLSGITCTKDGTTANQLDIASGTAYVTLSDGTTGKIAVVSDNTHTTSTPSTTYYLFLKNDGTWQWGTTSTGPTNSLPICQATTDGSGNILAVTDVRHTAGSPSIPIRAGTLVNQAVADALVHNFTLCTVPVTGMYRMTAQFYIAGGAPRKFLFSLSYTQGHAGGVASHAFISQQGNSSPSNAPLWDASGSGDTAGSGDAEGCIMVLYLQAGSTLTLRFQDAGWTTGTNLISGVCERLT